MINLENSKINFYQLITFIGLIIILGWTTLDFGGRYLHSQVVSQVFTGILLIISVFYNNNNKTSILSNYKIFLPSVLLLISFFLSFGISVNRLASLEEILRYIMYLSLPIIIFKWSRSQKEISWLLITIFIISTIVSLIGVIPVFWDLIKSSTSVNLENIMVVSTFYRNNDLAGYLLLSTPLSLSLFFILDKSILKYIIGCMAAIQLGTIILTNSRGAWLSIVIPLILMFFLHGIKIIRANIKSLIIFSSIIIFFVLLNFHRFFTRFLSIFTIPTGTENSINWRESLLRGTFRIFTDHPLLGSGINTFSSIFGYYQERAGFYSINPHCYYLQLLAETGIIGFISFMVLIFVILILCIKNIKYSVDPILKGISIGLFCSILSSLFHISVDIDWSVSSIPILFWTEVGLLCSIYYQNIRYNNSFKITILDNIYNKIMNFNSLVDKKSSWQPNFVLQKTEEKYKKRSFIFLDKVFICTGFIIIILPLFNYISAKFYINGVRYLDNNDLTMSHFNLMWAKRLSPWPSAKHYGAMSLLYYKNLDNDYNERETDRQNFNKALISIKRALELDRYNHHYYVLGAQLFTLSSNKIQALDLLIKAVELNPYKHPDLYTKVGDFYLYNLNNKDLSLKWYKKGINAFPTKQLSQYEYRNPGIRYELYSIYKATSELYQILGKSVDSIIMENKASKLLNEQEVFSKGNELINTPTKSVKQYWIDLEKNGSLKGHEKTIATDKRFKIFIPTKDCIIFSNTINFRRLQKDFETAKVEYEINLKIKNEKKKVSLIDQLVLNDDGWKIVKRILK